MLNQRDGLIMFSNILLNCHHQKHGSMGGATADSVATVFSLPVYTKSTQQHTRRLIFVLIVSFLWEVNLWALSLRLVVFPFGQDKYWQDFSALARSQLYKCILFSSSLSVT